MTIEILNSKWWYRLLKVFYLLTFLLVSFVTIGMIVVDNQPEFDNQKTYATCNNGMKISPKDHGVILYSTYMGTEDRRALNATCQRLAVAEARLLNGDDKTSFTREELLAMGGRPVSSTEDNFVLTAVYTDRKWDNTIVHSAFALVCIYLAFEVVRRIFYYVSLGKVIPK